MHLNLSDLVYDVKIDEAAFELYSMWTSHRVLLTGHAELCRELVQNVLSGRFVFEESVVGIVEQVVLANLLKYPLHFLVHGSRPEMETYFLVKIYASLLCVRLRKLHPRNLHWFRASEVYGHRPKIGKLETNTFRTKACLTFFPMINFIRLIFIVSAQ